MTRDVRMIQQETIRRLAREKRILSIQKEALLLLSLALTAVLGIILIAI